MYEGFLLYLWHILLLEIMSSNKDKIGLNRDHMLTQENHFTF